VWTSERRSTKAHEVDLGRLKRAHLPVRQRVVTSDCSLPCECLGNAQVHDLDGIIAQGSTIQSGCFVVHHICYDDVRAIIREGEGDGELRCVAHAKSLLAQTLGAVPWRGLRLHKHLAYVVDLDHCTTAAEGRYSPGTVSARPA
jgi:hypothetical protein